ncbi:DMT family transporter [Microbacterium sp. P05]|uniref:DMT family transporter n=1 Tax=Microbacterium sp. P05 TaxID=3366948 RepID=UPI003747694C
MPALLAVIAAAVLFGTSGTSQALGPADTTPWAVGAVRLVIGGTALAVIGLFWGRRIRRRSPVHPRCTPSAVALMALAGLGLAVYQPLFFLGTERNGVAVGTVVALGSAPVMAGAIEWLLTRRRPSRVWACATTLALAGVVLLALGGSTDAGATDPLGLAGSVGAGASFAVLANAQRRLLSTGWDAFTVAGGMGGFSALASLAVLPFVGLGWLASERGVVMALWLGLATITIAYALFTWGLQRLTAATAATLTLAEPLTAGLLGVAVLGEQLSPLAVAGLIVLGTGLLLLAWGSRSRRDPRPFAMEG